MLKERCSIYFSCHKYRYKYTCGVVVATACICLGCRFKSPWGYVYFYFLILARRVLYEGMRMGFATLRAFEIAKILFPKTSY